MAPIAAKGAAQQMQAQLKSGVQQTIQVQQETAASRAASVCPAEGANGTISCYMEAPGAPPGYPPWQTVPITEGGGICLTYTDNWRAHAGH